MKTSWTILASAHLTSAALDVDLDSADSIKTAAKLVATNLLSYYRGDQPGQTPGILPGPPPAGDYYWWEAGALWGSMVDYWHATGDATWNDAARRSLLFQAGDAHNYMPANWTLSLGNDDQGFWAMSAMLAAETRFPDPPPGATKDEPQWLALAQAVFNTQAARRDDEEACGGGLRWQIFATNGGYDYKNSIANGIFFNLGARLARYTGNATYADRAVETWDWMAGVGLIDADYNVYDGAFVEDNCTVITRAQFSYCAAVMIEGAAFMYNQTQDADLQALWGERLQGLVNRTIVYFFPNDTATERSCELPLPGRVQCNTDERSFKNYLHRWMAAAAQLAPRLLLAQVAAVLRASAAGAVASCVGDQQDEQHDDDNSVPSTVPAAAAAGTCGYRWTTGTYDGDTGAGQQMGVLGALISLLTLQATAAGGDGNGSESGGDLSAPPVTGGTGGTSVGDAGAGTAPGGDVLATLAPIGARDRAGAGILTAVVMGCLLWMVVWMNAGGGGVEVGTARM